ncbi:MAG: response regulator [Bacteroidota bacterium]
MPVLSFVMIVDDDEASTYLTRKVVTEMLSQHTKISEHFLVEQALQELEELSQAGTAFPDLIILDLNIPGMDGLDFLQAYAEKTYPDRHPTRVILFTNSLLHENVPKAREFPFVWDCVEKTIGNQELTTSIQALAKAE